MGGKVASLDLSRDLNYLAVCSRDDKIQVCPNVISNFYLVLFAGS